MATLGHIAVGMAAGKLFTPTSSSRSRQVVAVVALSAISLAPDLDVIAFALGIPYQATWGHRGAVHSLGFALLIGVVAVLLARVSGLRAWKTGLAVALVYASHGLLDTMTDGGLGIAVLWPFSTERLFAPCQPIPVAPIGLGMLSGSGARVLLVELLLFSPILLWALWPRRRAPSRADKNAVPTRPRGQTTAETTAP